MATAAAPATVASAGSCDRRMSVASMTSALTRRLVMSRTMSSSRCPAPETMSPRMMRSGLNMLQIVTHP